MNYLPLFCFAMFMVGAGYFIVDPWRGSVLMTLSLILLLLLKVIDERPRLR